MPTRRASVLITMCPRSPTGQMPLLTSVPAHWLSCYTLSTFGALGYVSQVTTTHTAKTRPLSFSYALLLLCGVSSAACVADSFITGKQLARPHGTLGRKPSGAFFPRAMYILHTYSSINLENVA
ncbi:hypothetical protein V8E55_000040 [Tylopilus felleus]